MSSVHSIFKFKALATKKHRAIWFSKWVHQVFPKTGIMLSMSSIFFSKIRFKESKCDIYNMDYISQSPIYCWKVNIKCVLKCTKLTEKNPMVICSRQTSHQLNTDTINLEMVLTKKKGGGKVTCPMFDKKIRLNKTIKLGSGYFMFQSNRRTYDIIIPGVYI